MDNLFNNIAKYVNGSDDFVEELKSRLKPQVFKKKEIVLRSNKTCTRSYFIQEGIMRLYYHKDGKEITEFFCREGEWVNSPKSFIQKKPDFYYIDAVEETQVLSLHVTDLVYLFENFTEMDRYARMDMGSTFIHLLDRLSSIRFTTAKEKYEHFLETYPTIHHRLPLGMVASYIGVAQETLSRLRSNK